MSEKILLIKRNDCKASKAAAVIRKETSVNVVKCVEQQADSV